MSMGVLSTCNETFLIWHLREHIMVQVYSAKLVIGSKVVLGIITSFPYALFHMYSAESVCNKA